MAWAAILLYCIWITPLKIGALVRWKSHGPLEVHAGGLVWGIAVRRVLRWPKRLAVNTVYDGHADEKEMELTLPAYQGEKPVRQMMRLCISQPVIRRFLMRGIKTDRVQVHVQLGLEDAALCALISSTLQVILSAVGMRRGHVLQAQPRFDGQSEVQGVCIVRLRLGNLLIVGLMSMAAYIWQKALIRRQQYGTASH